VRFGASIFWLCGLLGLVFSASDASGRVDEKARPTQAAVGAEVEPLVIASAKLRLEDVVASTEAHFPLLQALQAERVAREEELRAARGHFDLQLSVTSDARTQGFYENFTGDASLEQPTRLWGSRLFGGYRYSDGDFPSYEGDRLSDEGGEVRVGVAVPLLRGGQIDALRAEIARAEVELEKMTPELRLQRIDLLRAARVAFWNWVGAGHTVEIAEHLLEVAKKRQTQMEGRAKRGAEARINLIDNRRLIVERQALLRGAKRDFEQASIRLSLFLRDEQGDPLRPDPSLLPERFPAEAPLDRDRLELDLEYARTSHPLLEDLALQRERLEIDADLARNELLPSLDLRFEASQDFGASEPGIDSRGKLSSDPRSQTELRALLRFELPVQRRKARGRLGAATARIAQLSRRERLARDQIVVEALSAVEAVTAAYDQTDQARQNWQYAEELRLAEERKFSLGLSNLIDVNIREMQAATARRQLVEAQATYFRALADYTAKIARDA